MLPNPVHRNLDAVPPLPRARWLGLAVGAWQLLAVPAASALAATPPWVIGPGHDAYVAALLTDPDGAVGACTLVAARIGGGQVAAEFDCAGASVRVQLVHPGPAASVPFAVVAVGPAAAAEALRARIAARMAARPADAVWQPVPATPVETPRAVTASHAPAAPRARLQEPGPPLPAPLWRVLLAYLLALATVVVPALVGFGAGAAGARWRAGTAARALIALGFVAGGVGVAVLATRVSPWDGVLAGGAAALASWFGSVPRTPRHRLLAVVVACGAGTAGLCLAEGVARLLLPDLAGVPAVSQMRLVLPAAEDSAVCAAIAPATTPAGAALFAARVGEAGKRPLRVLHVGDSYVEGTGVAASEAFVAQLAALQPDVGHINAGVRGSGHDVHLLIVRKWLDLLPVDLVVLYPNGSDVADMRNRYPCCAGAPLLGPAAAGFVEQCPSQGHGHTAPAAPGLLAQWAAAPFPYALRVLAGPSRLARHALAALGKLRTFRPPAPDADRAASGEDGLRDAITVAIGREVQRRGIAFLVAHLAVPTHTEPPAPTAPVNAYDAWLQQQGLPTAAHPEALYAAMVAAGVPQVLLPPPDTHFSAAGHRIIAGWLAPQIRAILAARGGAAQGR